LRRWDSRNGAEQGKIPVPEGTVKAALSPKGSITAVVDKQGRVSLLDLASGKEKVRFQESVELPLVELVFSPDGTTLAVLNDKDRKVTLHDLKGRQVAAFPLEDTLEHDGGLTFGDPGLPLLFFSGDSRLVAVNFGPRTLAVFDASTGKRVQRW